MPVINGCGETRARDELTEARATIEHLERALQSNRRIGMAMGVLMERYSRSDQTALATLTRLS